MLKKSITYKDYDNVERTEDFYFNLTEAEITEMELSESGGLKATIERVVAEQDSKMIIELFKRILLQAYGKKSEDGRRFIKSDQLREEFSQTMAYNKLFMELAVDADAASAFLIGVIPDNLREPFPNVSV